MKFEIITVDKFNKDHGTNWESSMTEYRGDELGFMIGVTPEIRLKDGTLDTESTTFINSLEELDDDFWVCHRADMAYKYEWTGRLVFRGYYTEYYDFEERDNYYIEEDLDHDV